MSTLSDHCLNQVYHVGFNAPEIWNFFKREFVTNDLSSKSNALNALLQFNYTESSMLDSQTQLNLLKDDLLATFATDKINIEDLVVLVALINLPDVYSHLRTAIAESKDDTPTSDELFDSLKREEKFRTSEVIKANRTRSHAPPSADSRDAKCTHGFVKAQCWKCHPESRPTCTICRDLNLPAYRHPSNNTFCKKQRSKLTDESTAKANLATPGDTELLFNVDSGCTNTILANKPGFQAYSFGIVPIKTANNSVMHAHEQGTFTSQQLSLSNVLYAPTASENLLSVSQLNDANLDVLFSKGHVYIGRHAHMNEPVIFGKRTNGSFNVTLNPLSVAKAATAQNTLHLQLNHQSTLSQGTECEICLLTKSKKGSHPSFTNYRASKPGELVHTDICGPITPRSTNGFNYFLTFTDNYSRYTISFLLKFKSEALSKFKQVNAIYKNLFQTHIQFLRSDNGGEYKNSEFSHYCNQCGTIQQFTTPYSPHQNGVSERLNLTLMNATRSMLLLSRLSPTYWDEAVLNSSYTKNRTPSTAIDKKLPVSLFYQHHCSVSKDTKHLRTFGEPCFASVKPKQHVTPSGPICAKLSDRAVSCRFLGYSNDSKSYRLLTSSNAVILAAYEDVFFPGNSEILNHHSGHTDQPITDTDLEPLMMYPTAPNISVTTNQNNPSSVEHNRLIEAEDNRLIERPEDLSSVSNTTNSSSSLSDTVPLSQPLQSLSSDSSPINNGPILKHKTLGNYQFVDAAVPPPKDITGPPKSDKRTRNVINYKALAACSHQLETASTRWLKTNPKHSTVPIRYEDIEAVSDSEEWKEAATEEIMSFIEHDT